MTSSVAGEVASAYREEWARVVSTLIRITGDWSLAEDCAAEAFETALEKWERDGIPRNPGAWLTTVAKNRALDRLRRATNEAKKLKEVAIMNELEEPADAEDVTDDRLRLVFTCCHPALPLEARVALTLRTVAGLTTPEIASAFLVPEATMAQRIVRAKRKITHAGIPYRVPPAHLLPERLGGVLAVLYLLFNEGYSASSGTVLVRSDLAAEAIRLTRAVVGLMPDEPEARGLLALMLLQHSRRDARLDSDGELLTLDEQDRSRWDHAAIAEGLSLLGRPVGSYQLQAAIAAVHASALDPATTDWGSVVALYERLATLSPTPVIALNRAIAVGMARGFDTGLAELDRVAASAGLGSYYLVPAARADFLRRLGRTREAAEQYRLALAGAPTEPEQRYLARRLEQVEA